MSLKTLPQKVWLYKMNSNKISYDPEKFLEINNLNNNEKLE